MSIIANAAVMRRASNTKQSQNEVCRSSGRAALAGHLFSDLVEKLPVHV